MPRRAAALAAFRPNKSAFMDLKRFRFPGPQVTAIIRSCKDFSVGPYFPTFL